MTNKSDPISQMSANLVGLKARTGNMKNAKAKQSNDAPRQHPKPTIRSNRLNWNHAGSWAALPLVLYEGKES